MTDIKLDYLYVVYPGERRYPLAEGIEAISLAEFLNVASAATRSLTSLIKSKRS